MAARIEFVNHSSVLVSSDTVAVLSDPWYFGSVFHKGWSLLVENDDAYIRQLLERTTHIWISHEHPDHFSPPFFMKYRDILQQRNIPILFQKTRDGRVTDFLEGKGFQVIEIPEGERYSLSEDFTVRIAKSDLYDSALLMEVEGQTVFNLNDCPLHEDRTLQAFQDRYGTCDVLLTQFSYAAWKGGRDNAAWRRRAVRSKLNAMRKQFRYLSPKKCIPFASFVYFSNDLNRYMNDEVNTPDKVLAALKDETPEIVFMQPGEVQPLETLAARPESARWWQEAFIRASDLPGLRYEESFRPEELAAGFKEYQKRIFRKNSRTIMGLAARLLPLKPFGKTRIRLAESGQVVEIDMMKDLRVAAGEADVEMHSASLDFMFRNEFGFDTLFVNGCFEESAPDGFSRFAKCFAIGNLNAMGLHIGLSLLGRLDVIFLLIRKMNSVRNNVSNGGAAKEATRG
ncbi:MBL fold metallo-hydrolase [Sneathiella chinensis]|uniref:MBL fold metallo-hydrolase n=1 Tax=Sneathiella chinensis TaxID=349750 RepID=A0ABQ5U490_9PROT|nr:MBL fold metallo-hydrolase [Sneathiella chinensis]GLQ06556.1 hypothetical protein GCM10007924_17770 [Sneathiella chinensis]